MNDQQFEEMVRKIEAEVHVEAKTALGTRGFERWRNPQFCGVMTDADSQARLTGGCGDTMSMFVKIRDGRIERAQYTTDGCGSSSVAGSFTAELAMGKSVEEVLDMTGDDVLRHIGTFPEAEEHCATLAVQTLQEAVNSYLINQANRGKA
jgi:nitrogen fixation NifU-like protein